MKKLLISLSFVIFMFGCKNTVVNSPITPTPSSMKVVISGLNLNTSVYINIRSKSTDSLVLNISSPQMGNQTYMTKPIKYGEYVYVEYGSNIGCAPNGDGMGSITFYYDGKSIAPIGPGCLQSNSVEFSVF